MLNKNGIMAYRVLVYRGETPPLSVWTLTHGLMLSLLNGNLKFLEQIEICPDKGRIHDVSVFL